MLLNIKKAAGVAICSAAAMLAVGCTDIDLSEVLDESEAETATTTTTTAQSQSETTETQEDESSEQEEESQEESSDEQTQRETTVTTTEPQEDTSEAETTDTQSDVDLFTDADLEYTESIEDESEDDSSSSILQNARMTRKEAYASTIEEYDENRGEDKLYQDEYCKYYLTDMDGDFESELLVETGSCEADRTVYVYTYDGGKAQLLGSFSSWRAELGEGDGVLYSETNSLGSYILSTITIEDGEVVVERGEDASIESQLKNKLKGHDFDDLNALDDM
ncbi:MAG: hypothetical protein LUI06_00245 [Ruminococcus sp.]|nr:hypothetical protein [Ruminococcus sp.]